MIATTPRYVLHTEARHSGAAGQWRFTLASDDGRAELAAGDQEQEAQRERLELLSVVRGLEALDQPSHVTLVTGSRYVSQGLNHGLAEWRENDWLWERFGELVPVKNQDLWRRVDRALRFHRVECKTWRVDQPHAAPISPACRSSGVGGRSGLPPASGKKPRQGPARTRKKPWRKSAGGLAWFQRLALKLRGWRTAWAEA